MQSTFSMYEVWSLKHAQMLVAKLDLPCPQISDLRGCYLVQVTSYIQGTNLLMDDVQTENTPIAMFNIWMKYRRKIELYLVAV